MILSFERFLSLSILWYYRRRKWQPTPVFLPGESQGRGTWWAAISGVAQSRTRLKRLSSSSSIPFQGASLVAQWRRISLQGNRCGFDPWVRKTSWRREWHPIPLLLPGKSHGQRSLAGYSPWDLKESDTTSQLNKTYLLKINQCAHILALKHPYLH